jgi:uncharacterized protein (DUF1330 family)/SAM-dependent methyltransferase
MPESVASQGPVYALVQLRIHDRERYQRYVRRFGGVLARHEGVLLAADTAPRVLDGHWDRDKVIMLRFESEQGYEAWANSPEYREISVDREAATDALALLVHGVPARASTARYDSIGNTYARVRREDPALRARIHAALGDARTVVNVGAGAGSYEPRDRHVIAVEPSAVMASQRSPELAPPLRATAGELPLFDNSVDAAMSIISLHHWDQARERGVREMRRVARGPVVLVTFDPQLSGEMWLMKDYLPEVAELDHQIFPAPERIAAWLGGDVRIEPLPLARDTPDWMLGSYWAHPERVLDADARNATSGFARMPEAVVARVVSAVQRDLADGTWEQRYGHLRKLSELDVGLRLIVATL